MESSANPVTQKKRRPLFLGGVSRESRRTRARENINRL